MPLTRRILLTGVSAALLAPRMARAATITDDVKRTVTAPDKVHHVFPAGPEAAILLYTLAPQMLLGWPYANSAQACAYLLVNICRRPELGHLAGGGTPNLDKVTALKPDLILDVGGTDPDYAALADTVQRRTGIAYALLDGRVLSLSTSYQKLGRLIGREAEGADLADYCNQTLGVITNRIAFVPPEQRPRIYYAGGPQGLTTGRGGAIEMELIELLARNAAGDTPGGVGDVTIEQVRAWQPDAILASDAALAKSMRSDPAWGGLKAVRDNRIHVTPQLPFDWIYAVPSANRLIGLWWLATLLYPQHFKEDLRGIVQDFFDRFYHVTLADAQIERVLAGHG
ncbi:MAG TPA: ABC transporter substrate-binding protein [Pseudolabrys sp.]|nr:ABC transporter substrate-binding protein [Pseudolabrys sp.]